jgi:hypothetical protein
MNDFVEKIGKIPEILEESGIYVEFGENEDKYFAQAYNLSDIYLFFQHNCGLKRGDTVKVLRKAKTHELGWKNSWTDQMDSLVGKTVKVTSVKENGIHVNEDFSSAVEGFGLPFFVLEKVEEKVEDKSFEKRKSIVLKAIFSEVDLKLSQIESAKESLNNSRNEEEFHQAKRDLLSAFYSLGFLTRDQCIYCSNFDSLEDTCKICTYGKKHGICTESGSSYGYLFKSISDLGEALNEY